MLNDITSFFARTAVINLSRRPERWQSFLRYLPGDWPFGPPLRFAAVDGADAPPPAWWQTGPGAWGCYLSHLNILRDAIEDDASPILVLEDDAIALPGFALDVRTFLHHLPDDWGLIYLGGQHIELDIGKPTQVNDWTYRPFNVNRTHSYAVRGQKLIDMFNFLLKPEEWKCKQHVDYRLGEFQKQFPEGIYVPKRWLIGQRGGDSDVCGNLMSPRIFMHTVDVVAQKSTDSPKT